MVLAVGTMPKGAIGGCRAPCTPLQLFELDTDRFLGQDIVRLVLRPRECKTTGDLLQERRSEGDDTGALASKEDCGFHTTPRSVTTLAEQRLCAKLIHLQTLASPSSYPSACPVLSYPTLWLQRGCSHRALG